ncbi:hypothetical protein MRY87_03065 [bacterium]|nr:hypothetical protein [bacterium]
MVTRITFSLLVFFVALFTSLPALAQSTADQEIRTVVGVSGRDDKLARSPVVSVRVAPGDTKTTLFVDAYQRNSEYTLYPMQFELYVNRHLISTQYRSRTLPGPIGLDVGTDIATLPFNYTVIAKVIVPNGNPFTTVVEGAAFATPLAGELDCTATVSSSLTGSTSEAYVENAVRISQTGNSTLRVEIAGEAITSDEELAGLLLAERGEDGAATGTFSGTFTGAENSTTRFSEAVTGTIVTNTRGISELDLTSEDGNVRLQCS